jgi:cell wall-associated NlpC family hydrolase
LFTPIRSSRAALVLAVALLTGLAGCGAAPTGGGAAAADADPVRVAAPVAVGAPVPAPVRRTPAASRAAARLAFGEHAISVASRYAGVPYAWGGTTPRGFDCSGFTRYVFAKFGKHLPRSSAQQFQGAHKVGRHVRQGDLVFYHSPGGHVYHVGIYAYDGLIWHAPNPGTPVRLSRISTPRWSAGRY